MRTIDKGSVDLTDGCEACGHSVVAELTADFGQGDAGALAEPVVHCKDAVACAARVEVVKRHPGVGCRTCHASMLLVRHDESPEHDDCIGPTRSSNFCNTWKLRVDAGLAPRRALAR